MDLDKELPEIALLLKNYKTCRAKYKSSYNKYKRNIDNFSFLNTIIKPKEFQNEKGTKEDKELEQAVKKLFNSIGIKSVTPSTNKDFDIKSTFNKIKIGIEVKNGNLPKENEMFQAHKYAVRGGNEYMPLVIWNNTKHKNSSEFDTDRILDAELNSYGIMTTTELRKGYIKLKNEKISFNIFFKMLQNKGLIKYTLKSVKIEIG